MKSLKLSESFRTREVAPAFKSEFRALETFGIMKPTDMFGIAPLGDAVKIATEKTFETAQRFFESICLPAAAEVGLLLRDKVRLFRAKNLASIASKTQQLVTVNADGVQLTAHPRMVAEVVEHGSWCEDEQLQGMWAGLLASSCKPDGKDESNLLFADLLTRIPPLPALQTPTF